MKSIEDLLAGFDRFRRRYFENDRSLYERLTRRGQTPNVMVIACCDSRVDPAIVMDCDPGDVFVVRNVANLVPPCETGGGYHGTSAALEFAVRCLNVQHVIVMGHAHCGGIRALLGDVQFSDGAGQFIQPWMLIAEEARRVALAGEHPDAETRDVACEQAAIRISLENLMSFPFVRDAVAAGRLQCHGWYFDFDRGHLQGVDPTTGEFTPLAPAAEVEHSNEIIGTLR